MADTTAAKPDLKATHTRLRSLSQYMLELRARAEAAGAANVVVGLPVLSELAKAVTQSMMDLEPYLS